MNSKAALNTQFEQALNMPWLTGWRRIGDYLQVHWKTARRWHKQYGMPVLRRPGGRPVALVVELNLWLIEFNRLRRKR